MEDIFEAIKEVQSLEDKLRLAALAHHHEALQKQDDNMQQDLLQITDKYHQFFNPIYEAQNEIINGLRLATPEELELQKELSPDQELNDNTNPLPDYWLTVFKNCSILKEEISEDDHPILKHLNNIQIDKFAKKNFALIFHFSENPFFTNKTLRKTFYFSNEDSQDADWSESDKIEWSEGKNVTVKIVSKKQKNKKTGQTRTIEKEEPTHSFFNFFKPFDVREEAMDALEDEEVKKIILLIKKADEMDEKANIDTDLYNTFLDDAIPYSLQYFLGIQGEDCCDDEMCDDDEECNKRKKSGGKHKLSDD